MTHKSRIFFVKFHVLKCWMGSLRAECFFCNLDILYGGLGIGKLQFLIKKKLNFFSAVIFFQFLVIKALDPDWILIRISLQPQTLDPDPEKMNTDPKHCFFTAHIFAAAHLRIFNSAGSVGGTSMDCRVEIRSRACLAGSQLTTNTI
jgi:hypothetical protein